MPAPAVALLAAALLAGCATRAPLVALDAPASTAGCRAWFDAADAAVDAAGVRDVQTVPVDGVPHLRVDRLLVALGSGRGADPAARAAWLGHAAAHARDGWAVELANLPAPAHVALAARTPGRAPAEVAAECIGRLAAADVADPAQAAARLDAARVPDAYADWLRVVGLYPLTRWPVLAGYRGWRAEIEPLQRLPLAELPVAGRLAVYGDASAPVPVGGGWTVDALGVPDLDPAARAALLAAHAPLWVVDTVGDDDRPGALVWPDGGWRPEVDATRPTLYTQVAFTRVAGEVLPQLVYHLWFPARTPEREGDIYAGHLDGVILRVTLDRGGRPLLYDSIHPCGCYHMFFPGPGLEARPQAEVGGEGFHVPHPAPRPAPGQRVAVRLQAGTHQVLGLHALPAATPGVVALETRPYDALRSLPAGAGRRSAFGPDGLVPGTGRAERLLLWPMGVPSAGALRQWGRHATAFVGRRHFDDPGLVEAGFRVVAGTADR